MSLPTEVYLEPVTHPELAAALERACTLVGRWLADEYHGSGDQVKRRPVVSLQERIAEAILEARGYDVEELRELLDGRLKTGRSVGDCYAAWKRQPPCRCGGASCGLDFDGTPLCDPCAKKRADEAWEAD